MESSSSTTTAPIGGVRAVGLLTARVNLADYPEYASCERVGDRPGVHLCEYYMLNGVRVAVVLSYAVCAAHYYLRMRPRMTLAQRALHPLHHYLVPSGGYGTPVGLLAGLLAAAVRTVQSTTPDALAAARAQEQAAAMEAWSKQAHYLRLRESKLRAAQPWWERLLVACRLRRDRVQHTLRALGKDKPWQSYVAAHGLVWTALHSTVHDARWYVPEAAVVDVTAASSSVPPARFTKSQVDWVVSRSTQLYHSSSEMRWTESAGRGGVLGAVFMVVLWNSRQLLFRASMGFGAGVVSSALLSVTHIDKLLLSR